MLRPRGMLLAHMGTRRLGRSGCRCRGRSAGMWAADRQLRPWRSTGRGRSLLCWHMGGRAGSCSCSRRHRFGIRRFMRMHSCFMCRGATRMHALSAWVAGSEENCMKHLRTRACKLSTAATSPCHLITSRDTRPPIQGTSSTASTLCMSQFAQALQHHNSTGRACSLRPAGTAAPCRIAAGFPCCFVNQPASGQCKGAAAAAPRPKAAAMSRSPQLAALLPSGLLMAFEGVTMVIQDI